MTEFNAGDRVRMKRSDPYPHPPKGTLGTVGARSKPSRLVVTWDNGYVRNADADDLELVSEYVPLNGERVCIEGYYDGLYAAVFYGKGTKVTKVADQIKKGDYVAVGSTVYEVFAVESGSVNGTAFRDCHPSTMEAFEEQEAKREAEEDEKKRKERIDAAAACSDEELFQVWARRYAQKAANGAVLLDGSDMKTTIIEK